MTYTFNLLDEDWIPCRMCNGEMCELNIVETLCSSHRAREIIHHSPLVIVAIHRLLLAILHRIFGPPDQHAWRDIWERSYLEESNIDGYLGQWKHRFDLFHEIDPFYQTGVLSFDYATSTAKLFHELASGNNKVLFDHTLMSSPPVLTASEAARLLIAFQTYAIGGLLTYEKGYVERDRSADAAFMVKGAAVLVTGRNLFETLMLNLVHYNSDDGEPFAFETEMDKPAWERDSCVESRDRFPDGYLDWLTWQSRRVRLKPEADDRGKPVVREVVIMKGYQLPDGEWRRSYETMIAFRKNEKAKSNQEPWSALAFTEDRALWRDTLSLLQTVQNERARPKTVDWLADLKSKDFLFTDQMLPLSTYGLCNDRATVYFWRREMFPLPLAYLTDNELVDKLKSMLALAEEAGKALDYSAWFLARLELFPDESKEPGKEAKNEINRMSDDLAPGRLYWSRLEMPFKRLLMELPGDVSIDQNGSKVYGAGLLPKWAETTRRVALEAFRTASAAVGESARALKARAKAEDIFNKRLNSIIKPYTEQGEKGGEKA
jgi:CRISPR system Cascade subunit CasA